MKYKELIEEYEKMMDIAIWSLKNFDSKPLYGIHKENFYKYYEEEKKRRLSIETGKFASIASLKYNINDALIFFNEASNEAIEQFWKRIKEESLPFKRENKLKKILKRKRIANDIEFDFVTDVLVPYIQEGLITQEEELLLKQYLGDFELKAKKK